MPRRAKGVAPEPGAGGAAVASDPVTPSPRRGRPPAPGGFQSWTEADESQLELQGPEAPDAEAKAIEVRVVYLGVKRHHSIPRPGGLIRHEREDGTEFFVPAPREHQGNLMYNFDGQDQRGRSTGVLKRTRTDAEGTRTVVALPVVRRTERDNRPWAICRHLEHAAWFLNKHDRERNPEYQLRAPEAVLQKIKDYDERRKRARQANPDSPGNVLRQIQPAEWRERGGPIGEQLA